MIEQDRILYEDNHLIAVNKGSSELVQGDKTGDRTLADDIRDFIKNRDSKPGNVFLGVCHRLDRPTSGVVVFAKTGKALSRMNRLFRENRVSKTYWAVTASVPPGSAAGGAGSGAVPEARSGGRPDGNLSGDLLHYLKKNESQNKSYVTGERSAGAKKAELHYEVIAGSDRYFLIEVKPKTGRHHQIRAQLSSIGCPIKGDLKYGFSRSDPGGGIHLHARAVQFPHPVRGDTVEITAPVPAERLWQALEKAALTGLGKG